MNLATIIMPNSLRRSRGFLTVRTRSSNMEQSRTSKLHTTLSMPIDSSLIYARYILKRKLPMYYLSSQDPYISAKNSRLIATWLAKRYIYIYIYLEVFFLYLFLPIIKEFNYQIYTKFSRDYSTIILFFANILNISLFLSFKKGYMDFHDLIREIEHFFISLNWFDFFDRNNNKYTMLFSISIKLFPIKIHV